MKVAYIGDGNNIANTWIEAAAKLPIQLSLACPEGYDPDKKIMARGKERSKRRNYPLSGSIGGRKKC